MKRVKRNVIELISAERARQRKKWGDNHDDNQPPNALAFAGAAYAANDEALWPWDFRYWKPRGRRRNLIRAAALIIAELERMDRRIAAAKAEEEK
jgi:hypothetical protein